MLVAVYAPDGSSYEETAVLNGNQWTFSPTNRPLLGEYNLWVTAVDTARNETLSGPYVFYVVGSLTIGDIQVDEAAGTAELTIAASDTSFVTQTVEYVTADYEAVAPDDYTVDFWGQDAFSYYATDGSNNSAPVTVTTEVKLNLTPFVLLATDGVTLKQGVTVQSGGIGVNTATEEPYLDNNVELSLDMDVAILDPSAPVMGDSIYIETGAQVYDVYYNELFNYGTISGTETTPL